MIRQILSMTRHEIKLFLQRPVQLLILLGTPLAFILVLGQVFGRDASPTVAVFAVDEDHTRASAQVMDALDDVKTLSLIEVESRAEADLRVGKGEQMAAIVIPAGFGDALLTEEGAQVLVIADPARDQMSGVVVGQVQVATAPMLIDAEVTRGVNRLFTSDLLDRETEADLSGTSIDRADVQRFLTAALKGIVSSEVDEAIDNPIVRVDTVAAKDPERVVEQPTLLDYLVPGYTFFFAFFLVGMMTETVFAERARGTLRRLLTTPASRTSILLGKVLPFFVLALAQIVAVMGLSSLLFDFDLGRSPAAFLLMAAAGAASIAGFGVCVASLVRTQGQAGSLPDFMVIAMAVVSGAMFPTISVAGLNRITPHYWAIRGFQDVFTYNQGVSGVLLEAGVLVALGIGFFAIGVWRFRFE